MAEVLDRQPSNEILLGSCMYFSGHTVLQKINLSLFLFTDYAFGIQIYSKLDSKVFVVYGEIFIALYHKCAAGFHAPQFGLDQVGH